jgi:hypothetical protein
MKTNQLPLALVIIRESICAECPDKCQRYLLSSVKHDAPCEFCHLNRFFPYDDCPEPHLNILTDPESDYEWDGSGELTTYRDNRDCQPDCDKPAPKQSHLLYRPFHPQELWAQIHQRGMRGLLTHDFIEHVLSLLPAYGCQCNQHFLNLLAMHPVPYTGTAEEQFAWTVLAHNEVNRRLGKPEFSLEEARARWIVAD